MTADAAFETTRDPASARRGRAALYVASGIVLALVFRWGMARGSGGDWVAPLDDTYIHFQYAKLIARGEPFAWSPGDGYTTGATSVIWPLMLAVPHALGLGPGTIYVLAVAFGAVALASTAMMVAAHLERRLADPMSATLAGLAAVTGGSMLWGTFSGMEIPLATAAWTGAAIVLARWEGGSPPSPFGYVVLAALPLVRPEGVAVFVAVAAIGRRGRGVWRALPAIAVPFAVYLTVNRALTGQALPNGAAAKSLFAGDLTVMRALTILGRNLADLAWTFTVQGPPLLLVLGLAAAAAALRPRGSGHRAAAVLFFASLAIVLANRFAAWHHGRYLVPLLPLAAILAAWGTREILGARATRIGLAILMLLNAAYLPTAVATFRNDVSEIARQHVAAGSFLARHLPADARVALMDAGALAYFAERRGIDLVGLGTNGMARSFLDGPGAVLRALQRLPAEKRPTHFAVYPSFFPGFELVFGRELARFELPEIAIAADPLLVVYEARDDALATKAGALDPAAPPACDVVDAADVTSEAAHGASFEHLRTIVAPVRGPDGAMRPQAARVVTEIDVRLECAEPSPTLLRATLAAGVPTTVAIEVDGTTVDEAVLAAGWTERTIPLETGRSRIRLTAHPHVALSRIALEPRPR